MRVYLETLYHSSNSNILKLHVLNNIQMYSSTKTRIYIIGLLYKSLTKMMLIQNTKTRFGNGHTTINIVMILILDTPDSPVPPEFIPGISLVRVAQSFVVCVVFCTSLFVLFSRCSFKNSIVCPSSM